jgi:hypothetical protein
MAFREFQWTNIMTSSVPCEALTRLGDRLATMASISQSVLGFDVDIGKKLFSLFRSVGFESPEVGLDAVIGGHESWPGWSYIEAQILGFQEVTTRAGYPEIFADFDAAAVAREVKADLLASGGLLRAQEHIEIWARQPVLSTIASDS